MEINRYKVKREYNNKTTFFIVSDLDNPFLGIGFQVNFFGCVYGISITKN